MTLIGRLALFSPLALVVAATNYLVDPGNSFGSDQRERQVADRLLAGEDVAASLKLDEMRLRRDLAEGRRQAPEILVLGSSRAMMVGTPAFPGRDVVNASVSNGSTEEAIALFELYDEHGLRPRTVLLGVDPWALNGADLHNPSESLNNELRAGLRKLGRSSRAYYGAVPGEGGGYARWLRLASPSYFQASVAVGYRLGLPRAARAKDAAAAQAGDPNTVDVVHPDGSRTWAPKLDRTTVEAARANAANEGARGLTFLKAGPQEERLALLAAFVDRLRSLGVRVVLWLPPYHPAAYEGLMTGDRAHSVSMGEPQVRALAAAHHVVVLGSYDPAAGGAVEEDLADHHHLRRQRGNALLARLWAQAGL